MPEPIPDFTPGNPESIQPANPLEQLPDAANVSPESSEIDDLPEEDRLFLLREGFDILNMKEVIEEGRHYVGIPLPDGVTELVQKGDLQAWVARLRDEKNLSEAREKAREVFDGAEAPEDEMPSDPDRLDKEELQRTQEGLRQLAEALRNLHWVLRDRDLRYNPLIDDVGVIATAVFNLEQTADEVTNDPSYVSGTLAKVRQAVETIGSRAKESVEDDVDSLEAVAGRLKMFQDQLEDFSAKLSAIKKYDTRKWRDSVAQLDEVVASKYSMVMGKARALRNYFGG